MNSLEHLPEIVNRQLGGLRATPVLLAKAKLCASERRGRAVHARPVWQTALALCAALIFCVGGAVWALDGRAPVTAAPGTQSVLDSHAAGGADVKPTNRPRADVPRGSVSMSAGGAGGSDTLFADMQGDSFPLLIVHGATYRMLNSPSGVSSALFGDVLGTVEEFNVEPALGSSVIVSNIVNRGEAVYAVSGMSGALAAARVDGIERVFQRVSYAGTAVIGGENLSDTLCDASDVRWISVSGLGLVDDVDDAQNLMRTLLEYADYQSTAMSGSGSMQIGLSSGLTLQLLVSDDAVSACGTWSCPDFFEAFHEAVGK